MHLRCNIISNAPTTEHYFYVELPEDSPLIVVDGIIDIAETPQPWIVVENVTDLTVYVKNGDKIAEISPIDEEMMLDELE